MMARRPCFAFLVVLATLAVLFAGCATPPRSTPGETPGATASVPAEPGSAGYVPHVIVGLADTGINPYHQLFYRPNLTEHPCTYIQDFPCDVKELRLSVGLDDYAAALDNDKQVWESMERETWYWIPQTVFVAVACGQPTDGTTGSLYGTVCVLDDDGAANGNRGHGTATTSIAIQHNPDALIAFREGMQVYQMEEAGLPVDLYSLSWAHYVPMPLPSEGDQACGGLTKKPDRIVALAAGNAGYPSVLDCWAGDPMYITVGGGATAPIRAEFAESGHLPDVESYFCHPYAHRDSVDEIWMPGGWCGTSFATPAVAGGLSKVILAVRQSTGYVGTQTADGALDPIAGLTAGGLRDAMNRTASYAPPPRHDSTPLLMQGETKYVNSVGMVPLNPAAPWLQWGWGFYDGDIANATIAHLLGTQPAPEKPQEAVMHMETVYQIRQELYG